MAKKTIKLIKLSKRQEVDLRQAWEDDTSEDKVSLNELVEKNRNHTLSVLRQIKNIVVWKDIEGMVDFVGILKASDTDKDSFLLEEEDISLCKKVFSEASETGKISGISLELFIKVYKTFIDAL